MYCIKCGVELAEHEKKCPLCGTEIIYPEFIKDAPAPFPENKTVYRELNRNGFLFILSFLFLPLRHLRSYATCHAARLSFGPDMLQAASHLAISL